MRISDWSSGVCSSDLHGPGVTEPAIGERVALAWLGSACGSCRYCETGRENLCESQQNTGYSINGGYAEYAVADARFAVPVPDAVSSLDAAPLSCAGVTTYAAVKAAHVVPSARVAIVGVGGLGQIGRASCRARGCQYV